ncbi:myosin V [Jaminaea rosea]|uniref:Myosin V n=1 Tax=Jaminaea rosea TaxID=1569628 RepID=A0A316UN04_9BASI|nr:myosin V [Jaminaea rosea]PWN25731.1 myosin V [Jaminaea rosea]
MASSEAMTALSPYVPGTRAWFTDKDLGWISATQSGKVGVNEATGEVTIEFTLDDDESQRVVKTSLEKLRGKQRDEQLPPLRNPPLLEATDDLTNLSYLNEPAVLHAILSRYSQRLIYTYSGIVLIAVNPFFALNLYSPEIIQAYSGKRRGELEPHLFAIAEDAYRCMIRDEKDQTIVVSGESGAGKTVSAKYIMRYFATVEDPDRPGSRRAAANSAAQASGTASSSAAASMSETERQILATNPIMEAFGNAKTTRNDNSSRFGKYIEILFDRNHEIVGAKIRTYLLERSRLVYQPENERNYHIFYQLCAGAPASERKELGLDDASKFHYLNQGGNKTITGVDDAKDFKETQQALGTVGLTVERQWSIFRLLAALLHLGNVEIGATRNDAMLAQDEPSLFIAAKLLGIDLAEFRKWTVKKQIVTRGEKIVSNLTQAQAVVVRDSVAKYVYSCLFEWLVDQLNHSLALGSADARKSMIGVLDIYGFERFKVNSFEQFCINYANERLQHEFNRHVFKLEQDEYMAEEISWTFIDFSDNQPTIDMIESRLGILSLLDEESRLPSGADASFLQKLYTQMERKPEYKNSFKKPRFGQSAFTVCHYALDVEYEVEGFLEKNRDAVPDEHLTLLGATTSNFLKEVLETATQLANAAKEQPSATAADGEKTAAAAAVRRPGAGIVKKPTLGSQFKASLVSLMTTIDATNVHYIRCIKPNEAKRAWEVEPQNVLGQLRACGVLETIRISCAGYPSRWTFADFAERYYMLVPSAHWDMTSLEKAKELAAYILKTCVDDADKYQIGLNKIFFRAGMLAQFEQRRGDRLKSLVTLIQKNLRRNIQMRKYGTMRSSSVKLQSWWRMQAAKKQVNGMRQQKAAVLLQTALRAWLAQQSYRQTLAAVVRIQSLARGRATRSRFADTRVTSAAVRLQSLFRGLLARRQFLSQRKGIVLLQSLHRRRLAKRELISLRNEAKSAKHFKEVTYKLENKVVELTQNLQKRTKENKELVARVRALEASIAEWQGKHEELDVKSRGLQTELDKPSVPLPEFEALIAAKKQLDEQHDAARRQITVHEEKIAGLEEEVRRGAEELEARESALSKREDEDNTTATSLRAEISKLREELARAHSLAQLSGTSNGEPAGGAAATRDFNGLYDLTMGKEPTSATTANGSGRRAQRPRSADVAPGGNVRKAQAAANRHVSVMPPQQLMDRDEDAVVEEIESILLDEAQLDEDLLQGLIQQLRVPMGDDISPKECLFPSHLIALVLNEYWLRSMIRPSERVLANVMQTIQTHVMSLEGDELVTQAIYWISNVHELLSFVSVAESDLLAGITPGDNDQAFGDYERLIVLAKHDLESLEYNIYHTLIDNTKRRLHKMVVPAVIESQSLPGFIENSSGRLFNRLISSATNAAPAYTMDDVLNILNTVWRALKTYYLEAAVVHQVVTELMRLINSTAFNDLVLRRSFCSWKRAMQIQYNITRIEEWCKTKGIPEAMLQLEHLSQSVKLLQLKKSTVDDVSIIFDVSWILSPSQIHKLLASYHTAEYEQPISQEILKAAAARVVPNDRNDHLLLPPEVDEAGPYELPMPREVTGIETYIPSFIQAPSLRKLSSLVA